MKVLLRKRKLMRCCKIIMTMLLFSTLVSSSHRVTGQACSWKPEYVLEKLNSVELQPVKSYYTMERKPTKLEHAFKTYFCHLRTWAHHSPPPPPPRAQSQGVEASTDTAWGPFPFSPSMMLWSIIPISYELIKRENILKFQQKEFKNENLLETKINRGKEALVTITIDDLQSWALFLCACCCSK